MKKYKKEVLARAVLVTTVFMFGLVVWRVYRYYQEKSPFDPEIFYPVISVLDGDTFTIKKDTETVTIRMLGINTPETVDPRRPVECYGKEASMETKRLLMGNKVRFTLSPNREVTDKYGRYLAYVYTEDGLFINRHLIEHGYALEYTYGSAYSLQKEFKTVEKKAKREDVGLWKVCI